MSVSYVPAIHVCEEPTGSQPNIYYNDYHYIVLLPIDTPEYCTPDLKTLCVTSDRTMHLIIEASETEFDGCVQRHSA